MQDLNYLTPAMQSTGCALIQSMHTLVGHRKWSLTIWMMNKLGTQECYNL